MDHENGEKMASATFRPACKETSVSRATAFAVRHPAAGDSHA